MTYSSVLNTEMSSFQGVGIERLQALMTYSSVLNTEMSSFQGVGIERFHSTVFLP